MTQTIKIEKPPGDVFATAGDYGWDPTWRQGVVSMTLEPTGPASGGSITREEMRFGGRPAVTVAEIIAFDLERKTAFHSLEEPIPCEGFRLFEGAGSGTNFTYSLTLKPAGWWRWGEWLLKPLFERQIKRDLKRLKSLVESK